MFRQRRAKQRQTLLKPMKAENIGQVSRNGGLPTTAAVVRKERVRDNLSAASRGRFPVLPSHWPTYKGALWRGKWKPWTGPQDTEPPGHGAWVPAAGFLLGFFVLSQRPSGPKGPP